VSLQSLSLKVNRSDDSASGKLSFPVIDAFCCVAQL